MISDLIITTYNRPDALEAVLLSLIDQTVQPNQVIIADDGSTNETHALIEKYKNILSVKLIHSWHEDNGFRAAESRNKALSLVKSDYVIIVDGDMVLENHFIEDHLSFAEKGFFLQGGRVLMTAKLSNAILENPSVKVNLGPFSSGIESRIEKKLTAFRSPILGKFFAKTLNNRNKVRSCNMSFFYKDIIAVNGFNNKFVGWGREDSEFVERLIHNGIQGKLVKFVALGYHLYHKEESRKALLENDQLLHVTIENKLTWCDDGLSKYLGKDIKF